MTQRVLHVLVTVSYTHLNVYKRQDEIIAIDEQTAFGIARPRNRLSGQEQPDERGIVNQDRVRTVIGRIAQMKACLLYTSRCV